MRRVAVVIKTDTTLFQAEPETINMGNSVQQYRAAIGGFASHIACSRWTNRSGDRARRRTERVRDEINKQKAGSQIAAEISVLWTNISTIMSLVLGDLLTLVLLTAVTAVVANNSSIGVTTGEQEPVVSIVKSHSATGVASVGEEPQPIPISAQLAMILLLVSGDVETNPGPTDSTVEAMAGLIAAAPTDTIKEVLGRWGPDVQVAQLLDRHHKKPQLQETLAWLWSVDIKDKKVDMAKTKLVPAVLVAMESLLPDTCQTCQQEYCVKRGDKPALRCQLCHQGFHQSCLETLVKLTEEGTMPEFPGKMLWVCSVCAPTCEVMTTVFAGTSGTSAGRPTRRSGRIAPPPTTVAPPEDPAPPPSVPPAPPPPPTLEEVTEARHDEDGAAGGRNDDDPNTVEEEEEQ